MLHNTVRKRPHQSLGTVPEKTKEIEEDTAMDIVTGEEEIKETKKSIGKWRTRLKNWRRDKKLTLDKKRKKLFMGWQDD
jgi:pyridoxine 5'-phosphate synthase PdxJ